MISGIFFVNTKGEIILSRYYRGDISKQAIEAFRYEVIQSKNVGTPIVYLDNTSFLYTRSGDLFLVVASKMNVNPAMVFQFLYKMVEVFVAYFGGKFDESSVKDNYVLIHELLDESMDNGWPQVTATNLLKELIASAKLKGDAGSTKSNSEGMTAQITGAVDWRQPDKYKYRKNDVYIDVLEAVNLLMSSNGRVLRADVSGKIMMKAFLSGMPECKFGLNDKLVMEKEQPKNAKKRSGSGIAIDDVTFHRCVKLGKFDEDRTINFTPPDGQFELMKYRITQNVNLPFRVIPHVEMKGRTRVEYKIDVKGNFSNKLFATNVVVKIPTPKNTAKTKLDSKHGKAKYYPEHNMIIWKIKKFAGDASYTITGDVRVLATMDEKQWARPPITMEFQVPMFTASGLHVRFLKVFEKSNYQTTKWVRYITRAGQYEIRI